MRTLLVNLLAAAASLSAVHAQVFTFGGLNLDIPDSDPNGVFDERTISTSTTAVGQLAVNLTITGIGGGAFNGDLYATLAHTLPDNSTTLFSVLLNRPGRRAADEGGYSDNGFSVTFDDVAGLGDVHNYRLVLGGNHDTALGGALTGTWKADGRVIDPSSGGSTFDATSPTGGLGVFQGVDPNGSWRLFVADLGEFTGGTARLDSWQLQISAPLVPVPEPAEVALATALGLGALAAWRGRRAR